MAVAFSSVVVGMRFLGKLCAIVSLHNGKPLVCGLTFVFGEYLARSCIYFDFLHLIFGTEIYQFYALLT